MMGLEHVVDCTTGQGMDRDWDGVQVGQDPAILAREKRQKVAFIRLQERARADQDIADLLTVLGLEDW
jgi:hypothetical protein